MAMVPPQILAILTWNASLCDSSPPALRHLCLVSGLADGTVHERASLGDRYLPMIGGGEVAVAVVVDASADRPYTPLWHPRGHTQGGAPHHLPRERLHCLHNPQQNK